MPHSCRIFTSTPSEGPVCSLPAGDGPGMPHSCRIFTSTPSEGPVCSLPAGDGPHSWDASFLSDLHIHIPLVKVQCALYQLVMDLGCLIPVGSSHPPLVKVQCAGMPLPACDGPGMPHSCRIFTSTPSEGPVCSLPAGDGPGMPLGSSHPLLVRSSVLSTSW